MNSDTDSLLGQEKIFNTTAMETKRLVYCLSMLSLSGWTLTWFSDDFWRTMKE